MRRNEKKTDDKKNNIRLYIDQVRKNILHILIEIIERIQISKVAAGAVFTHRMTMNDCLFT